MSNPQTHNASDIVSVKLFILTFPCM